MFGFSPVCDYSSRACPNLARLPKEIELPAWEFDFVRRRTQAPLSENRPRSVQLCLELDNRPRVVRACGMTDSAATLLAPPIPMEQARVLLVEFGECFFDARVEQLEKVAFIPDDFDELELPTMPHITGALLHLLSQARDDCGRKLAQKESLNALVRFGDAYCAACVAKTDFNQALQEWSQVLLAVLAERPAWPEDVEYVFPYEICLADA